VVAFITAAPDADLPAVVQWLTDANAHVFVLALDPAAWGAREEFPVEMEHALQAAGATVCVYRRGAEVREYLINALLAQS
jgi:hypothetical protein